MTLSDILERAAQIDAELAELEALDELDDDQEARFEELIAEGDELAEKRTRIERRDAARERVRLLAEKPENVIDGREAPQIMRRVETDIDVRTASRGEVRDAAFKMIETADRNMEIRTEVKEAAERAVRKPRTANYDPDVVARRLVVTENPAYRSAFLKGVTSAQPAWTNDEVRALEEFRAMSIGTDAAGGFGVPVLIDPSIVLTSGAADAPILQIARIENITTDVWRGVSSAGVSWSIDGEATAVSDDSPTLAQPTVTTYRAQGFIPFSIEVGQDYPGFAAEMAALLEQGYVDLVASQTATGTGSSAPFGIFTAIDATAGSEVAVTTDGALGPEDALKVWGQLPERYRSRASWFYNTTVENELRNVDVDGTLFSVNLGAGNIPLLLGRPTYRSDYAPTFTGTTGAANLLVVGDFSRFVVAQRAGINVELVPHLVDVTNNRPTGERGWYAWARFGSDSIDDNAFRLLQNQ